MESKEQTITINLTVQIPPGLIGGRKRDRSWIERFNNRKTEAPFELVDGEGMYYGKGGAFPSRMRDGWHRIWFYWDFLPYGIHWSNDYPYAKIYTPVDSRRKEDRFLVEDIPSFSLDAFFTSFRNNVPRDLGFGQIFPFLYGSQIMDNTIVEWERSMTTKYRGGTADVHSGKYKSVSFEGFGLEIFNTHHVEAKQWDEWVSYFTGTFTLQNTYTTTYRKTMKFQDLRLDGLSNVSFHFGDSIKDIQEIIQSREKKKREEKEKRRKRRSVTVTLI